MTWMHSCVSSSLVPDGQVVPVGRRTEEGEKIKKLRKEEKKVEGRFLCVYIYIERMELDGISY